MPRDTRHVALLRGINVGGRNLIGMTALRTCFEAQGFADVLTYIQSGNVIFTAQDDPVMMTRRIEAELSKRFGYEASIVLRSRNQMRKVVTGAPRGFGARPTQYRYDVLFLREPLRAADLVNAVPVRAGVDRVFAGAGVLYFSRLIRRASQSLLNRLVTMAVYKQLTIRNWNTTTRLLALMETDGRKPGD